MTVRGTVKGVGENTSLAGLIPVGTRFGLMLGWQRGVAMETTLPCSEEMKTHAPACWV